MATENDFRAAMAAEGINVPRQIGNFEEEAEAVQKVRGWWMPLDTKTRDVLQKALEAKPDVVVKQLVGLAGGKGRALLGALPSADSIDVFFAAAERALGGTGAPPEFAGTEPVTVEPPEPAAQQAVTVKWGVTNVGGPAGAYKDHVEVTKVSGGRVQELDVEQGALEAGGTRSSEAQIRGLEPGSYMVTVWLNWLGSYDVDYKQPPDVPKTGNQMPHSLLMPLTVGGVSELPQPGFADFNIRVGTVINDLSQVGQPADAAGVAASAPFVASAARAAARMGTDDLAARLNAAADALGGFNVTNERVADAVALLATAGSVQEKMSTATQVVTLAISRAGMRGADEDYDRTNPAPAVIEAIEAMEALATGLAALKGAAAGESEGPEAESTEAVPEAPPTPPTAVTPEPEPETPEPSAEVKQWATDAATSLVYGLTQVSSDEYYLGTVEWLREDLETELISRASDTAGAQAFSSEVQARLGYIAGELSSERRITFFAQLMMRTNQGAVWLFVKEWPGFRPEDVGEGAQPEPEGGPRTPPLEDEDELDGGFYGEGAGGSGDGVKTYYLLDAEGNPVSSTSEARYVQSDDGSFVAVGGGDGEDEGPETETEEDPGPSVVIDGHRVPVEIDRNGNPYVTTLVFND